MSSRMEEAALDRAREMFVVPEEPGVEAEETPSSEEGEPAVEATGEVETAEDEPAFPSYEVELPEDLLAELAIEDDPVLDLDDEDDPDEYEDLELSESELALRKQLLKTQKENEHLKGLRVKDKRKDWEAEAKRFFPLAESVLPGIQADSRRAFLRAAKDAHDTVLPFVKAERERNAVVLEAEKETARAEAKEEARKAWGTPPEGPQDDVPSEAEHEAQIAKARRSGDFADTVRAMMFPKRS